MEVVIPTPLQNVSNVESTYPTLSCYIRFPIFISPDDAYVLDLDFLWEMNSSFLFLFKKGTRALLPVPCYLIPF